MATNPSAEKGEGNSVVLMKGMRIDLITPLAVSFAGNKDLKELVKHALFMSSMLPDDLIGKKEE